MMNDTAVAPIRPHASASIARRCPVCDGSDADELFANRMAPIAEIDFSYAVVACNGCGMVHASRTPDDATMVRYYAELSKYDHPTAASDLNACDLDRAEVAADFTRRVAGPDARVLDVGCSIGLYLSALARRGSPVRGLDPSVRSAAAALALFDVEVEVGDARDFDRYADFDCIALLAVLEHLRDPARLLKAIAGRMKPGATLIVEVPDADAFGRHPAIGRVSEPLGEFSNEHINFFGAASLRRLAQDAGLSFVGSEPFHYTIGIDGLLAAFRKGRGSDSPMPTASSRASVSRYVAASRNALADVETRLRRSTDGRRPVVLYGAGSHSARLLAQGCLADAQIDIVLDRNPHLAGRTIGAGQIALPETLAQFEGRPVIVSTFHAMTPVVDWLGRHFPNEIVPLYARPR